MTAPQPNRWSRGRWWFTVAFLFALQVGVIFFVSAKLVTSNPRRSTTTFRFLTKPFSEQQALSSLMAPDPTVFVIASAHGFSGAAWLKVPAQDYSIPDWDEPFRSLEVNVEQLGNVFTNFVDGAGENGFQIADKLPPPLMFTERDSFPVMSSRFLVRGAIAKRIRQKEVALPVWPNVDVLKDSVVEVSVDGRGDVVFTRLIERCGLPGADPRAAMVAAAADQRAVAIAREMTFAPINHGRDATNLLTGKIIFQWATVATTTNSVSEFE